MPPPPHVHDCLASLVTKKTWDWNYGSNKAMFNCATERACTFSLKNSLDGAL